MNNTETKEEQFKKIDNITNIFTIVVCICLGSIFLGACVYMLNLINEPQDTPAVNSNNTPQNVNLISM